MMKRYYPLTIAVMAAALTLGSCIKKELYNTAHPEEGTVVVSPTWTPDPSNPDAPQPNPAEVIVTVVDGSGHVVDLGANPDYPFTPGDYTLVTTNKPDGVTVSGTTATVAPADPGSVPDEWEEFGPFIDEEPGWLFTGVEEIYIGEDSETSLQPSLEQQLRELTVILTPTGDAAERIVAVDACLTGVAGSMDFAKGTYGNPSSIRLPFRLNDEGKWTATVRLLGIADVVAVRSMVRQQLLAKVHFRDDSPLPAHFGSDLTEELARFNSGKNVPLVLSGTLLTTPNRADVTATITDWSPVKNDDITIH